MRKIALVSALLSVFVAGTASAQSYYPTLTPTYPTGCVAISYDLSFGSRGSEVRTLQQFLVRENYPGGGNWMITGYFGNATVAAVRNFQITAGLPSTGFVDSTTRSAIQARTCGSVPFTPFPYQNYPTYPTPTYPTFPTYPTQNPPTISSLSQYNAVSGTIVTIYGSNFDAYSNTIRVGPSSIVASSQNGTQLSFSVPAITSGSYQVSVSNGRGTSNSLTLSINAAPPLPPCTTYGGTCCNPWGGVETCGPINITYLTPTSGSTNTAVTIYGSGFSQTGNTVHFGQGIIANASSIDGRSVSFTVPTVLVGFGSAQVQVGNYPVYVTNSFGQNSNTLYFNVTSTAGSASNAPTIGSVSGPTTLNVGQQGTWSFVVQNYGATYLTVQVRWGDENVYPYVSAPQALLVQSGQSVTFSHSYQSAGTYTITFTASNSAGSNTATTTVVIGGGTTSQISLSSLQPTSGRVGSQITLQGTGFTASNDVHFGVGGTRGITSASNTYITFVVPTWVSPCDLVSGGYCGAPVTQVLPGQYPVYVTNSNGATNVLYFTVIQ